MRPHIRDRGKTLSTITNSSAAIDRARDMLAIANVWDASTEAITGALTDLLHLAWVGTTDDGEGMLPESLVDDASSSFRAEIDSPTPGKLGHDQHLQDRHARLARALRNLHREAASGPLPSTDPLHTAPAPSARYTANEISDATNKAATALNDWLGFDGTDEGPRDLINLVVNVSLEFLSNPGGTVEDAIRNNYGSGDTGDPTDDIVEQVRTWCS